MAKRLFVLLGAGLLTMSCTQDPHDAAREYVESGDRFAQEGRPDAALIEYRNAVKEWPMWAEANRRIGDALGQLGRTEESYRAYSVADRIVNDEVVLKDEDALRNFVAEHPEAVAVRVALAQLLIQKNRIDEAEEHLLAATAAEPSNELANRALAAVFLDKGRTAEAEARLTIAAAQKPQRYRSQLALADFLMSQRRYAEVRKLLEEIRQNQLLASDARLRLASIDYDEGAVEAANRTVSDLLKVSATPQAWTLQADFRLREGKLADALVAGREALALDPHFKPAVDLVHDIRERQLRLRTTLSDRVPSPSTTGLRPAHNP